MNKRNYRHGLYKHPLYNVWHNIKKRCNSNNKKIHNHKNYGGRGITICEEWRNDLWYFFIWAISNGWKPNLQIDRIDNNGNYEPENCKFVTSRQNNSNRNRKSKYGTGVYKRGKKFRAQIVINGKNKTLGTFNTPEEAHKAYIAKALEVERTT